MSMLRLGSMTGPASIPTAGIAPPSTVGTPTIDNTSPTVGDYLTGTAPTFTGTITGYVYSWRRTMTGSPFTATTIPSATGTLLYAPALAATETIQFGVSAYGPGGSSPTVWSSATAAVARSYLSGAFASPIGAWSPTIGVVSGYAGSLIDLTMDGVTQSFGMTSKGLVDVAAMILWWQTHAGTTYTDYNGLMPRVSKIWCQGTASTAHYIQATDANRPICDFNLLNEDGTLPISVGSYGDRSTMPDGTSPAVAETDCFMAISGTPLGADTANHTIAIVAEGLTNIAVSTPGSYPSGQYNLMGMSCGTTTNRFSLQCGSGSWSSGFGVGIASGTTRNGPVTPLLAPANRILICELQTTTDTVDSISPSSNAVASIRINNNTSKQWTGNTASRSSIAASSGGYILGRGGSNGATSGAGFAYYGSVHTALSIVTGGGGDLRNAAYASAMKVFGVRDDYTTNFNVTGASSVVGYAGSHGLGFAPRLARLLGPKAMVTCIAQAGAKNETELVPNRVALSGLKQPGLRNVSLHYVASSDIGSGSGGGGSTGAVAYGYAAQFLAQIRDTAGWYKQYGLTFVVPRYQTASVDDPFKQAQNVIYNSAMLDGTNQTTYVYTALDPASISQFSDPTNQLYRDGTAHLRASNSHGFFASYLATYLAADIA